MAEHTPGPWKACTLPGHDYPAVRSDHPACGYYVASCSDYHASEEENEANARLIAAAPDLLAACRAFVAWDENPHATEADAKVLRQTIASAIARAEGKETP